MCNSQSLKAGLLAIIFSLPMAVIFSFLYRFPAPFIGDIGPYSTSSYANSDAVSQIITIVIAWLLYGIAGGHLVIAIAGFTLSKVLPTSSQNTCRQPMLLGLVTALSACILLANINSLF